MIWSDAERMDYEALIASGHTVARVAKRLGRTPIQVIDYSRKNNRIEEIRARAQVYTLKTFGALFGADKREVKIWHTRKWVRATPAHTRRAAGMPTKTSRTIRIVSSDAIDAFVLNRETWPAWSPDNIADPDWREYARDVRAAAGGAWLSSAQVAARYCYQHGTVEAWVRRGQLDGVRRVKYGGWYFWSADLEGWAPPQERRAYRRPRGPAPAPAERLCVTCQQPINRGGVVRASNVRCRVCISVSDLRGGDADACAE